MTIRLSYRIWITILWLSLTAHLSYATDGCPVDYSVQKYIRHQADDNFFTAQISPLKYRGQRSIEDVFMGSMSFIYTKGQEKLHIHTADEFLTSVLCISTKNVQKLIVHWYRDRKQVTKHKVNVDAPSSNEFTRTCIDLGDNMRKYRGNQLKLRFRRLHQSNNEMVLKDLAISACFVNEPRVLE